MNGNQTRNANLGISSTQLPKGVTAGSYASPNRAEATGVSLGSTPKPRGFKTMVDARHHMGRLQDNIKVGDDVMVDGKLYKRQPMTIEQFGHPDSKQAFKFGFGPGRYNSEFSVANLQFGSFDAQIPTEDDYKRLGVEPNS